MTRLRPFIRYLAALICVGAAYLLLARSGLPDRIELSQAAKGSGGALEIGSPAPPFELMNTLGKAVALDGTTGVPTIINFWATWCAPCRQEMRDLQQLQGSRPDSVRVLAINMGEAADLVADWRSELGLSYDLLLDPALAMSEQYLVRGIPTTYLLDSAGQIRKVYYGPVTYKQLDGDIQRLAQRP